MVDPLRTTTTESGVRWGILFKWVIGLVAVAAVATLGLYIWTTISTGAALGASDDFLALVDEGKLQEAYASTAAGFRATQDEERFLAEFGQIDIKDYSLPGWTGRLFKEPNVFAVSLEIGEKDPLETSIVLSKEGGDWKVVLFADENRLYLGAGAWFQRAPTEETVRKMAVISMGDLINAMESQDFTALYDTMAPTYTVLNRIENLQAIYQPLIDDKLDITAARGIEPILDAPPEIVQLNRGGGAMDGGGAVGPVGGVLERARTAAGGGSRRETGSSGAFYLIFEGNFPTEAVAIPFKLTYHYEHPEWQLHSLIVKSIRR